MEGAPKLPQLEELYVRGEIIPGVSLRFSYSTDYEDVYEGVLPNGKRVVVFDDSGDSLDGQEWSVKITEFDGESEVYLGEVFPAESQDQIARPSGQVSDTPLADALSSLRKPLPEEQRSSLERQTFEKGEVVRQVQFTQRADGKFISEGGATRKAFILEPASQLAFERGNLSQNDSYTVRIKSDSAPGKSTGFLVVELLGPDSQVDQNGQFQSAEQRLQADMQELYDTVSSISEPEVEFEIEDLFAPDKVIIKDAELADEPRHQEMLAQQAARLRAPEIQTALRLASKKIHPRSSAAEVLRRASDMRSDESTEGVPRPDGTVVDIPVEKHRHFTALGSAMYFDKAAYSIFNAGLDTAVEHSAAKMREWLQTWEGEEPPRLPVLVIGTGPHGATFLSTYAMYSEGSPAVAIDERARIGGQFAVAEKPVLRLNSRNRPQMQGDNRNNRNLPGTEQTINPLGTLATLQVSDLSGESYVTQDALAHATRFNAITSADDFLTQCTLKRVESFERNDGSRVDRCTFLDQTNQQSYTIDTDNLVIAGGIGKDVFRLANSDVFTESQLEREERKLESGVRPVVMSFPQMLQWFGNPDVQSPIKGVKTAAVSGSGDSANVAIGILLGYEPGADRMPVSVDRVEKVYWIGQDIPTKEQWLKSVRGRYAQVGLEMPREIENYYSRIDALPVVRAEDVSIYTESGQDVSRLTNIDESRELVNIATNRGDDVNGVDLYVACNGFQNDLPEVLSGFGSDIEYEELFDEEGFPIGKRVKGTNTILVGPAAGITLSEEEKAAAPVLERINENTAALFRYNRGTEKSARLVAERTKNQSGVKYDYPPGVPLYTLRTLPGETIKTFSALPAAEKERANAYHIDNIPALQLALADYCADLKFPPNLSQLEIDVTVNLQKNSAVQFEMPGLAVQGLSDQAATEPVLAWLQQISKDPLIGTAIGNEVIKQRKRVRGQSFVQDLAVQQAVKTANKNLPVNAQINSPSIERDDRQRMVITIPIKGARADVQGLQLEWEVS